MKRFPCSLARLARLTAVVAVAGLALPHGADAAERCRPAGTKTLVQTRYVRVYAAGKTRVYGCLFSTGKPRRLDRGSASPVERATIRVNGRFVGFVRGALDSLGEAKSIESVDLKSGEELYSAKDVGGGDDLDRVTDLAVTAAGALAWIVNTESGPHARRNEVETIDSTGRRTRDVATLGADIDERSLAVAGNRVYWTKGDAAMTVKLQ